jgi:hypothetical protein
MLRPYIVGLGGTTQPTGDPVDRDAEPSIYEVVRTFTPAGEPN